MNLLSSFARGVLLGTFLLQVDAAHAQETQCARDSASRAPRFEQPLLVPDASWTYHVFQDLRAPETIGTERTATFVASVATDGTHLATFVMGPERQALSANIFEAQILSHSIANDSSGVDLTFTPPMVHFDYPMTVGKHWGASIGVSGSLGGAPVTGDDIDYQFTVLKRECLTTEAGRFDSLVVSNIIDFPALGQRLEARLWVSADGLLLKRESYVNDTLVQELELTRVNVPVSSMLEQVAYALEALAHEAATSPRAWAVIPLLQRAGQAVAHARSLDAGHWQALAQVATARGAVEGAAVILDESDGREARSTVGARVVAHQLVLVMEQLKKH
jgi:hypothetical protein